MARDAAAEHFSHVGLVQQLDPSSAEDVGYARGHPKAGNDQDVRVPGQLVERGLFRIGRAHQVDQMAPPGDGGLHGGQAETVGERRDGQVGRRQHLGQHPGYGQLRHPTGQLAFYLRRTRRGHAALQVLK